MNFTVTAKGRQFDRLALMYLGDTEVFRTSTSEPTVNGIVWTYVKEMEQYNALWKTEQKIIFDLPNIVNDVYTSPLSTTLTATFFTVPDSAPTADEIIPISMNQSGANAPSAFMLPTDTAKVSVTLPKNINRAVVSLSACGQQAEEQWFSNVPSSDIDTFDSTVGTLAGYSPFREVQLLIDGQLAGVAWPFPIVFTGGIVPGFWRPIAGIDTYDLRQQEIDVSPFLPLLCNGAAHSFEIRVVGIDATGTALSDTINSYWVVTGTIFLFLTTGNGAVTTGSKPSISAPPPKIELTSSTTTNSSGANDTLTYDVTVSRSLSITSSIKTSAGSPAKSVSWTQQLYYSAYNHFSNQGYTQYTNQNTTGVDQAVFYPLSSAPKAPPAYTKTYAFPFIDNTTFKMSDSGDISIEGTIARGLDYNIFGTSVFPNGVQSFTSDAFPVGASFNAPGQPPAQQTRLPASSLNLASNGKNPALNSALLTTEQTGSASYFSSTSNPNSSYSFRTRTQHLLFSGLDLPPASFPSSPSSSDTIVTNPDMTSKKPKRAPPSSSTSGSGSYELYKRHVEAVNSTIVADGETFIGRPLPLFAKPAAVAPIGDILGTDSQVIPGVSVRAILGRGPGKTRAGIVAVGDVEGGGSGMGK